MRLRTKLLLGFVLFLCYFLTRLVFLTKIPIFTDEAIYIRWGQIALQDPAHRFISLEDGKQPLFIWLMLPALKWIADPLVAGRLISVISGMVTMIGLVALSWRLFSEKIGWLTGLVYIVSPFFLLYDRLALYDSLTTATMVWALFFSIILVQTRRLDVALLLGMTVGAGFLTKSSAQFALILLPTTLLLFSWKEKRLWQKLLNLGGLWMVVIILSKGMELLLRLAPLSHMIGLKDHTFIVTLDEFIAHPFERFIGNFGGLWNWTYAYLTLPFLLLSVIGTLFGFRRNWRNTLLLFAWCFVPFFVLTSFGKVLYPRYLLFMFAPILPIMACGLYEITDKAQRYVKSAAVGVMLSGVFLIYPAYFSYFIITDPLRAPLPHVDRFQLLDDWPSGYGIPEIVLFLKEKAREGSIFVGTEGTFGLTPAALEIYLRNEKNIQIKGYWPIGEGIPELIDIAKTGKPTYLLLKDTQIPDSEWPVVEIVRYRKGVGDVYSILLQVIPKK